MRPLHEQSPQISNTPHTPDTTGPFPLTESATHVMNAVMQKGIGGLLFLGGLGLLLLATPASLPLNFFVKNITSITKEMALDTMYEGYKMITAQKTQRFSQEFFGSKVGRSQPVELTVTPPLSEPLSEPTQQDWVPSDDTKMSKEMPKEEPLPSTEKKDLFEELKDILQKSDPGEMSAEMRAERMIHICHLLVPKVESFVSYREDTLHEKDTEGKDVEFRKRFREDRVYFNTHEFKDLYNDLQNAFGRNVRGKTAEVIFKKIEEFLEQKEYMSLSKKEKEYFDALLFQLSPPAVQDKLIFLKRFSYLKQ